jgi:PAS domain S-box-containing protein
MRTDIIDTATVTDRDYYMLVVDNNGKIHFANSHLISNFGLHTENISRLCFFDLIQSNHQDIFRNTLLQVQQSGKPSNTEIALQNGSLHWIKWDISPYQNEAGITRRYMCVGYDIVQRSRVRKMNTVAQKNYQSIVESMNIGILMQDANGDVLAANQKAAEIFELSIEQIYENNVFKNLWQTTLVDDVPVSYENSPCEIALRTGKAQTKVVVSFKTADGEMRSLLVGAQPLFDENNSVPISVISSFIDISQEKKLEEEVHRRDILFRTFKNNTPNLAWVVDEDANLVFANNAFYKNLGLDENAMGKNILELVPKEIAHALEGKHIQVLESGNTIKTIEKTLLADNTELVFWISIFPIDTLSGKKMIGGEAVNITHKIQAEKKLKNANDRLYHLSRIATDAVWEWDMSTGEIFRNDVLNELMGLANPETQNLNWWLSRIHPEDSSRVSDTINKVFETKAQNWECEYRLKKNNGEYIIVHDHGYVIYENKEAVKMIGSLHDITEVKELEAKLLEEKIQHQKNLTETVFTVQEKERTRIGHELHDNVNQILGASKMFLDLIKTAGQEDQELKLKVTEYILMAIEEIRRLSKEMVTPLLKEKGLVESINTLVNDLKAAQTMEVLFHHDTSVEELSNGKKVTLFRIVQEQIKNTLKYSQAKLLTLNVHNEENNVVLEVSDDGVGFDAAQTSKGIGLSNIYERANFYNGTVTIKTAPGMGCKMTVKIPL